MDQKTKGMAAILSAAFIYSFYGILSRMLYNSFDIFFQFWSRSLALCILLLLIIMMRRSWERVDHESVKWFLARGIIGTFSYVMTFVAVNHLEIGTTLFIFYAGSTLGGYFIGAALFKEGLSGGKLLALFLSILGLYLIYSANIDFGKAIYVLVAFLCGVSTSVWNTFSKKVTGKYGIAQIIFIGCFVTFIVLFVISLVIGERWEMPGLTMPWLYSFIMLLLILGTSTLIPYGFSRVEAQLGTFLMLIEVIFTVIFAYLFFKETIGVFSMIGGMLIIIAVFIPEIKFFKTESIIHVD